MKSSGPDPAACRVHPSARAPRRPTIRPVAISTIGWYWRTNSSAEMARSRSAEAGPGQHRLVHRRLEDDDPALAARLRRVHRDVGVAQQVVGRVDARPAGGDADAGPDVDVATLRSRSTGPERRRSGASATRSDAFMSGRVAQEDGELVAAEPGGHVAWSAGSPGGDHRRRRGARRPRRGRGVSLTILKSSRSRNRTTGTSPARVARLEALRRRLWVNNDRLASPVSGVVRGLVVELFLEPCRAARATAPAGRSRGRRRCGWRASRTA